MSTKTVCTVTRTQFATEVKPLTVVLCAELTPAELAQVAGIIGAKLLHVEQTPAKQFSTDSLGWYASGKANLPVGDKKHLTQVGVTLTLVGSKELPKELPKV